MQLGFVEYLLILSTLLLGLPALGNEYLVEGRGLARADYGECLKEASQFTEKLNHAKLRPIEDVQCERHAGAYAPSYRVLSESQVESGTIRGSAYSTLSFCELKRLEMQEELSQHSTVVESRCHQTLSEGFEPEFLVVSGVRKPSSDQEGENYNSIDVLVKSVDAKRLKHLYDHRSP
ncbi:MAG: hypothetical protein AB1540_12155 [Bdellovibrionota bacterium]